MRFYEDFDPGLNERMAEAEEAYFKEFQIPYTGVAGTIYYAEDEVQIYSGKVHYRSVSEMWLETTARIDDEWVSRAGKLTEARNLAAHFHDELRIARKLGLNGPNALAQAREECLRIRQDLIEPKVR